MAELARARPSGPAPRSSRKPGNAGASEVLEAPGVTDVTRLLERCTTLIERLERRTRADGSGALQLTNPLADTKGMLRYVDGEKGAEQRFTRDHMLLDYQQVLDRYGQPDNIFPMGKGLVCWSYELKLPDGDTDDWTLYFLDGRVSQGKL